MLPHAGYIYSGPIAAKGMAALAARGRPAVVVILGPNHYGVGAEVALSPAEAWETPLGRSFLDSPLAERLRTLFPRLSPSEEAHHQEHSLEVILPFLQHLYGEGLPFLPIALADQSLATCTALGEGLSEALKGLAAAVIASSDLSHYYPQEKAESLDQKAIEAVLTREPEALQREIDVYEVNMCGPGAVMAMLACLKRLGAARATLLGHATSGDTGGGRRRVVGYCAVLVE